MNLKNEFFLVLMLLWITLFISACNPHNPSIGNLSAEISSPPGTSDTGSTADPKIVQIFAVIAPDGTLSTQSTQSQENNPGTNLGLNGGAAASDQAVATGLLKTVTDYMRSAGAAEPAPEPKPEPPVVEPEPEPKPEPPVVETSDFKYHHWNFKSWDSKGTSMVLCPGTKLESVEVNGNEFVKHGSLDEGREVWTDYDETGVDGDVRVVDKAGKVWEFSVKSNGGMLDGKC